LRSKIENNIVYAYYYTVPDEISYRYHSYNNYRVCQIPLFTGFTVKEGPCCQGCVENEDVGCETFILKDEHADGSHHFFLRKICKDGAGAVTITDVELDGQTEYVAEGEVLPPNGGDCSA